MNHKNQIEYMLAEFGAKDADDLYAMMLDMRTSVLHAQKIACDMRKVFNDPETFETDTKSYAMLHMLCLSLLHWEKKSRMD